MKGEPHSIESLFEALLDEPPRARADFYSDHGVPDDLAGLVEELFAAHASADFDLPDSAGTAATLVEEALADVDAGERVGEVIDERYRLESLLGAGTYGAVFSAEDLVANEQVAVKLPSTAPLARAILEREAACLRCLDAGVATLKEQGTTDGAPYLVLDLVDGRPFPGSDVETPARRRALLVGLLKSLSAVHAQGVVHRDLKPDNVMVTGAGDVVLIDFGIAHGPAFAAVELDRTLSVGTDAYAAPEQLAGGVGDARSDVYSCALLGLELLTGQPAKELRDGLANAALEQLTGDEQDLGKALDGVVRADRSDRPAHGGELLELVSNEASLELDEGARFGSFEERVRAVTASGRLVDLFDGLEPLLHLRTGAAHELSRRGGTDAARAIQEIRSWVERGLAFRRGQRVQLHAPGLDILRAEHLGEAYDGTIQAQLRAGETPEDRESFLEFVMSRREALENSGHAGRAEVLLASALGAVREWPIGAQDAESRLLPWLVRLAVQRATQLPLDRAAFDVARSRVRGGRRTALEEALRTARASARGEHSEVTRSAFGAPAVEGSCDAAESWAALEAAVLSHQVRSSLRLESSAGRAVRRRVMERARSAERGPLAARRCLWLALRAYRLGHFSRAASLHRESARLSTTTYDYASALLNAASAAMEVWSFEAARQDIERATARLATSPFPTLEARAVWTRRAILYRGGELPEVDRDLDRAYAALGAPRLFALHGLNEAAAALRMGNRRRAREMASGAVRAWGELGAHEALALCRAIALAAGSRRRSRDEAIFSRLGAATESSIGLQVLALAPGAPPLCSEHVEAWLASYEPAPQGFRFDVLETREIATALGLAQNQGGRPSMA